MMSKGMRMTALAVGAGLALGSAASAGDDTLRLDLKTSKSALKSGAVSASAFEPAGRAQLDAEDTEDVNFRYWRGSARASWGGGYVFPRAYAFRAGYYNSGGYYPGNYIARAYSYGPSYYASYSAPVYYSAPAYYAAPAYYTPTYYYSSSCCYSPIGGTEVIQATTLQSPVQRRMAEPEEPAYSPRTPARPATPAVPSREYQYDGPAAPQTKTPTYRYDGDPAIKAPAPREAAPAPAAPSQKIDPADGRLVKMPAAKKYSFQAYGENRKTQEGENLLVKKDKN